MKTSNSQGIRQPRSRKAGYVQRKRPAGGAAATMMGDAPRTAARASSPGGPAAAQAMRFSQTGNPATLPADAGGAGIDGAVAAPGMTEGGLPGGIGNAGANPAAAGTAQGAAQGPAQGPAQGQAAQAQWAAANRPDNWFSRIGGMEGIMSGMSNVQKVYGMYKQLQPMVKWLNGLGGGIGATAALHSAAMSAPRHRGSRPAGKASASGTRKSARSGNKKR